VGYEGIATLCCSTLPLPYHTRCNINEFSYHNRLPQPHPSRLTWACDGSMRQVSTRGPITRHTRRAARLALARMAVAPWVASAAATNSLFVAAREARMTSAMESARPSVTASHHSSLVAIRAARCGSAMGWSSHVGGLGPMQGTLAADKTGVGFTPKLALHAGPGPDMDSRRHPTWRPGQRRLEVGLEQQRAEACCCRCAHARGHVSRVGQNESRDVTCTIAWEAPSQLRSLACSWCAK
jgi:hypothetical protein